MGRGARAPRPFFHDRTTSISLPLQFTPPPRSGARGPGGGGRRGMHQPMGCAPDDMLLSWIHTPTEPMMAASSRFAVAVHILTLLADAGGEPVTSEYIAASVNTNPSLIRRLLSALARAGLTTSQLGTGGGALLA